ncbi:MAG: hypothetical protein L0Y72_20640 [Gemmataceae bacterium]|nr:hypothetical protein [Gemmataceae bacterium]MCI0741448.1 hypothetical protein [Gemmataceae bacterium]
MAPRVALDFDLRKDSKKSRKPKSTAFEAVEDALDEYVQISTVKNLLALTHVLGVWKTGKQKVIVKQQGEKPKYENWTDTNRSAAVRKLSDWLILESEARGIFPTSRTGWSGDHNCYAYTMNCLTPDGNGCNSWPGKYADNPSAGNWVQGVVDDGAAQGVTIQIERQGGLPTPVPAPAGGGRFLAALVSSNKGFHFMRRNDATGLWTHKNGAGSKVETYFYDSAIDEPLAITDKVVARILAQPTLIGCSMTFEAFLRVPLPGIKVKG